MPARFTVWNVGASFPIRTSNENPKKRSPSPISFCDHQASRARNDTFTFAEVFGNSRPTCHWPNFPQSAGYCSSLSHALSL
jgi:hypothetical protein